MKTGEAALRPDRQEETTAGPAGERPAPEAQAKSEADGADADRAGAGKAEASMAGAGKSETGRAEAAGADAGRTDAGRGDAGKARADKSGAGSRSGSRKKKKRRRTHPARTFFIKLTVIIAAFYFIFTYVFAVHRMNGNSMFPKVCDGDLVITYRLGTVHKDDVVLYRTGDGITRVGRVVAMPGSRVDISEAGELTVDGGVAQEEIFYPTAKADGSSVTYPLTAGDDQYIILNDYRSDAEDSRTFGAIDAKDLEGSAIFVMRRRGF